MTTATRPAPHHNTLTCYVDYRCRRPECVARMRAYERQRRADRAAGIQPFTDAAPVRRHLHALHAIGISASRIATLTGLPERTISGFTERQWGSRGQRLGLRQKTTHRVANLILSIQPDPTIAARVNSIGSRRRIQALIAAGWPKTHIAARSGISYSTLTDASRHPTVMASTAAAIAAVYTELGGKQPSRGGVSGRQAKAARERGAAERWPTPKYWDENPGAIDDPEFEPLYGLKRVEIIAGEARWLMDAGFSLDHVAVRLGVSSDYVTKALREVPEPATEQQVAA